MSFSDKLKLLSETEIAKNIQEEEQESQVEDVLKEDVIVSAVCRNFWCKARYDKPMSDKRDTCYKCDSFDNDLSGGVSNNGKTALKKSNERRFGGNNNNNPESLIIKDLTNKYFRK